MLANFMKHILLMAGLSVLGARVLGQGMIYTFSGHVTDITQDAAGSIRASGLSVGDSLAAVFEVDLGRPGSYTQNDGLVVFPSADPHDVPQYHYYYNQLMSGLPIRTQDGGALHGPDNVASWNYAYDYFGIAQRNFSMGILQGGSENEYVVIRKTDPMDATIATWKVGDSFEMNAWASGSGFRYSVLFGTVTLTQMQAVPEPSAGLFIGLGTLFLFTHRRRQG